MNSQWISVRVLGELALFTRPESKVERVSYSIMTPSAARGVLEAIFWKPEFRYAIREVWAMRVPETMSILRNEVNSKMSMRSTEPYFADHDRTQRQSLCLREVDYVIFADVQLKPGVQEDHAKYRDQFRRRVERGQCYHRPALGCREFAAEFEPWDGSVQPAQWDEDLGLMLWDMDYAPKPPHQPLFFQAQVNGGIMRVPNQPIGRAG